jgi:hypothetical protein
MEIGQYFQASNPSEMEAHVKLPGQLKEDQKKARKVPGKSYKTQETQKTYRIFGKIFRQAIQVKLKPMLTDSWMTFWT